MIDLRNCVPGQKLKSKHGMILTYVERNPEGAYYDHTVEYPDGSKGTRTNDGYVYKYRRLPEDHDIIEIIDFLNDNEFKI